MLERTGDILDYETKQENIEKKFENNNKYITINSNRTWNIRNIQHRKEKNK